MLIKPLQPAPNQIKRIIWLYDALAQICVLCVFCGSIVLLTAIVSPPPFGPLEDTL